MTTDEIGNELFLKRDEKYALFQAKLLPTVEEKTIIGVRTPELRELAAEIYACDDKGRFLSALPHQYFEENQLHAFVISLEKDFDKCIEQTEAFLPYVDNWATCDQLSPKAFKKEPEKLLPFIDKWLKSEKVYTVRFGIGMLMKYFLDDRFKPEYARAVAEIRSEEYYVNMMRAWYFATALAKQYDLVLPYISQKKLDSRTHNMAIQKSIESRRITDEQKAYLRTLRA